MGQDEIIAEDDRNGIVSSPVGPRLIGLPMPSPVQMPVTSVEPVNKEILQSDQEPEVRRKRFPTDKAYFIAKEILMTERTYKKDLEVIVLWFQEEICKAGGPLGDGVWHLLFHLLDPIYEFHCALLREVEHRLATWEGRGNAHLKGDYQRVGDIFLNNMNKIIEVHMCLSSPLYRGYLTHHLEIIEGMERAYEEGGMFQNLLQSFEAQKVAYLPLNAFLLKPLHRLIHYKLILQRLVSHYTEDHEDLSTCEGALRALNPLAHDIERSLSMSEQKVKLIELGRDLIGLPPPPSPEGGTPQRQFILEGCLQKLSRDGYHQRMFFLFSDVLVYANRTTVPFLGFRVHGSLPLAGMMLEEAGDPQVSPSPHSFTIYSKNRAMMVAGSSEAEKKKWVEAIRDAVSCCVVEPPLLGLSPPSHLNHLSLKSAKWRQNMPDGSSEEVSPSDSESRRGGKGSGNVGPPGPGHHPPRNNTTVHVCWHRNRSMSIAELHASQSSQLSGYLLRKFKNHSGWQKLWVVFTHLCLFFYKTCQDDFPLASLPMLGYIITIPSPGDAINKDYVFKLQFKNHVYFFRAESEYTFSSNNIKM
ncbi:unnamed protein product [Darwinula stevensoni]|uniref:Uncharacterized protein n=1 Tax=Darwinula stevensoni TaxID=69355 RepID=A0A7R8X392_9CRUS|nr:unnamed protein product [Darwinula stevensoni]CAG0882114.1 unnamed protein product [Darwinula stevensoni]